METEMDSGDRELFLCQMKFVSLFITFDMLFSLHSTVFRANLTMFTVLFFRGSVTHTNRQGAQWWEVDLGRVYKIHHIVIYGRTDCCSERIQGARVSI